MECWFELFQIERLVVHTFMLVYFDYSLIWQLDPEISTKNGPISEIYDLLTFTHLVEFDFELNMLLRVKRENFFEVEVLHVVFWQFLSVDRSHFPLVDVRHYFLLTRVLRVDASVVWARSDWLRDFTLSLAEVGLGNLRILPSLTFEIFQLSFQSCNDLLHLCLFCWVIDFTWFQQVFVLLFGSVDLGSHLNNRVIRVFDCFSGPWLVRVD